MAEYIDREEYCEKHCPYSNEHCDKFSCPIWRAPAADVAPVQRGKWIRKNDCYYPDEGYCEYRNWECSECGEIVNDRHGLPKVCPGCGAVM